MNPHSRPHLLAALLAVTLLVLAGTAQGASHATGRAAAPAPERLAQRAGSLEGLRFLHADAAGTAPQPTDVNSIRPGQAVLSTIPGSGVFRCTSSFVFRDNLNPVNHYLGLAGNCVLPAAAVATHGPGANYNPAGVVVSVCVANCQAGGQAPGAVYGVMGPVAYARQTHATGSPSCLAGDIGNDFALVKIPLGWYGTVKTAMAVWQGPYGSNSNEGTGNLLVEHGDGTAKVGLSLNDGVLCSFQATMAANGPDAGAAVSFGGRTHNTPLGGEEALGTLTHRIVGLGLVYGTTVQRSLQMASADAGLTLTLCDATTTIPGC